MNSVIHFEIPYDDEERAKKFYKEAFDWNIMNWPLEDGSNYIGLQTSKMGEDNKPLEKGQIGGGMVPRARAANPVITLKTDNAEEVLTKAVEAGAEKVSEHTYVGVGKSIYIKDSEGNVICLWEELKK